MALTYTCEGGIVAWLISGTISNDKNQLAAALKSDTPVELITDRQAKFMAAADLGFHWERLAKLPVLFTTEQLREGKLT